MTVIIESDRLVIREWTETDADAALRIYGSAEVARWLSPAMDRVPNKPAMRLLLRAWIEARESLRLDALGIRNRDDRRVVRGRPAAEPSCLRDRTASRDCVGQFDPLGLTRDCPGLDRRRRQLLPAAFACAASAVARSG